MSNEEEPHGIRLPTSLLDQIQQKEDKGDYKEDNSRFTKFDSSNKKRKQGPVVSRKEKRQQERELKKQKRSKKHQNAKNVALSKRDVDSKIKKSNNKKNKRLEKKKEDKNIHKHEDSQELTEDIARSDEDPMEELRRIKQLKSKNKKGSNELDIRIVKEDDLKDDSFDEDDSFGGEEFYSDDNEIVDESENLEDDEDPMERLRKLKANNKKKNAVEEIRIVKEDDLGDDSFDSDELNEEEEANEDPMEQLRKLKERLKLKNASVSEVRIVKEDDMEEDDSFDEDDFGQSEGFEEEEEDEEEETIQEPKKAKSLKPVKEKKEKKSKRDSVPDKLISSGHFELMKRDEDDMAYYAKKLGLKNGRKAKLSKQGDDDMIGGLLDGLDFLNDSYEENKSELSEEEEEELSLSEQDGMEDVEEGEENSDYVSFDEGDFDEDELRELREMEELENSSNDEQDDGETHMVSAKENPYMAPETSTSGGYIPPALRRKMALESNDVSEETLDLQRSIKRQLNKLSEANITSIVNEVNQLYLHNPRQLVTENLTTIIMDSIQQQGRLLDTFVYLHACLVVAIHRLQGVEFGAYFIQTLIEKVDTHLKDLSGNNKEISNLISLLSSVYTFQLISSRLLYDLIKELIGDLNESNAELLLRLIQNSGNQMRSDDPQSLKEIILLVNKKSSSGSFQSNPRTQFLIETITSLKNNKLKVHNEGSQQLIIRMKKVLGTSLNSKNNDPLQVSLEDIRNVEERGKWWLVGSAWKGYENENNTSSVNGDGIDFDTEVLNDILDNAEPNWVELARSQRMNTDIRRAIFISIMSANDYIDAMTKLDKLALKRSQEREIPRIILHCTGIEPAWNPYYGVLASKLCDTHSYRKTFQFMLWDLLKEFEGPDRNRGSDDEEEEEDFFGFDSNGDDIDDETKLKKILNLGRFFGYLLAEGCLPLNILRTVNFLTANGDTLLFLEILFITFLDNIAKKSQINSVGAGTKASSKSKMFDVKFEPNVLIERVGKAHEQPVLLKGIQYFLSEKVKRSAFITGRRQRDRIEWGISTMSELIDDLLKN